jgi:hypothetical protein
MIMDTGEVTKILDNIETGYNGAHQATRDALDNEGFDWEDRSKNHEPAYYYEAVGQSIVDFIKEGAGELADDYSVTGLLFREMLSSIDRRELGEHYYEDVVENS